MIVLHSAHVHNSYSDEERRRRNTSKKEKEKKKNIIRARHEKPIRLLFRTKVHSWASLLLKVTSVKR